MSSLLLRDPARYFHVPGVAGDLGEDREETRDATMPIVLARKPAAGNSSSEKREGKRATSP
eukprot:scaffold269003_cov30-Tisochrysis_lutea.AAC.1